ncbi:hypothetical protein HYH03_004620 [Edaphochlamys debaryana]|uniref:CAAX prenyl protease 2/Lysostaphin resistance protein A-like domain-containing protein n=1 Tax=Edaphochlamys debaryana TaxID=47281 RepID=A0A835YET2_9CHLO|nr:hypothetical protein HYH03_004620 [Edaphochlamys debaryana]|eukprot:KAG2497465.1 hypothetical protein HYH03_004620 [Edaphochlamys debaryana]
MDGINWWCYTVLGLIFLTDFTPFGALLLQGGRYAGPALAAVQWGLFVGPTLWLCGDRGWDVRRAFRLCGCNPGWLAAGAAAGVVLWCGTAAAIAARTGVSLQELTGAAAAAGGGGEGPLSGLLFGELLTRPGDAGTWAAVLGTSALSPAVAEELLYRGFLLTALRQRLGSVDAAALAAALFGAAHLSVPQFFGLTLLGGACGALTLRSGSVLPAVAAHAAYNATGIGLGVALALASR